MLQCRDIHKAFGSTIVLAGVDLEVADGEVVALLGPSGSGKSTLLRLIAGLDRPDRGTLSWDGADLRDTPVHRRRFGLMFQEYALFPHKSVWGNVAFGLTQLGLRGAELKKGVDRALEWVGMEQMAERQIDALSGGEQQRVALARTLAPRPRLVMLDEPLGALDRLLRERLVREMRALLLERRATAIYVTHDHDEAASIADRVALINDGHIVQTGTIEMMKAAPKSEWVSQFLGA